MPPQGQTLVWCVEHPDLNRTVFQWDHDGVERAITVLGRLGDERAAAALRRYAIDGPATSAAIDAIRKIEVRAAR